MYSWMMYIVSYCTAFLPFWETKIVFFTIYNIVTRDWVGDVTKLYFVMSPNLAWPYEYIICKWFYYFTIQINIFTLALSNYAICH